jgi:hypothetical protein
VLPTDAASWLLVPLQVWESAITTWEDDLQGVPTDGLVRADEPLPVFDDGGGQPE